MPRKSISYLGFKSLNDIDKNEIKRIYLVSKKRYPNIDVLLNEVKNLDDSDDGFNNWLIRKQRKQLKSSTFKKGKVLSVMSATGHGLTKRKKKRKPRKKKSVKKRKGKSKKKRVRRGRKSRRRS